MKRSRPLLLVVPSLQEAWEDVIAPWFDQVLPGAWQRELPSLVVVPTRGQANDIKARLIAKGSSHLGLQFVTPSSLRALLARDDATPTAQPELLRLLLAIAASEMEDRPNESEALAAKAVARAPAPLLRALDRLETAGWKFEELGLPSFAPVVQRFNELLKKCDFVLRGESDRSRLQQPTRGRREFSHAAYLRIRRSALGRMVSSAQRGRTGRKRHDRARRTPRKLFRCRSLLDRLLGRSLWRSPTRVESERHRARRFAFQRNGNARRRGNGKAFRFFDRHKLFRTSRSDHAAMRSLFGR